MQVLMGERAWKMATPECFYTSDAARLCRSKGASFSSPTILPPLADSDPLFFAGMGTCTAGKTRTLRKNREACGTQSFKTLERRD